MRLPLLLGTVVVVAACTLSCENAAPLEAARPATHPPVEYYALVPEPTAPSFPLCRHDDVLQRTTEYFPDGTVTYSCVWPCSLWTVYDGTIGPRRVEAVFIRWQGQGSWAINQPGYQEDCAP